MPNKGLIDATHTRRSLYYPIFISFQLLYSCQQKPVSHVNLLFTNPFFKMLLTSGLEENDTPIERLYSLVTLLDQWKFLARNQKEVVQGIKTRLADAIRATSATPAAWNHVYLHEFEQTRVIVSQKPEKYIFHIVKIGLHSDKTFNIPSTQDFRDCVAADVIKFKTWALAELIKMVGNNFNFNITERDGMTPLMYAAGAKGHEGMVKLILAMPGINVNSKNEDGWTALMYAAANGAEESVDALLSMPGIDIHAKDYLQREETAEMLARRKGHVAIADKLLSLSASQRSQTTQPVVFSNNNNDNDRGSRKRGFEATL